MRRERNLFAAQRILAWLRLNRPDVVILPNGMIQEFGVFYEVARHLDIPVITIEFSDKREEIWLAQNDEIMRQNTDQLWQSCRDIPLTQEQRVRIEEMETARMGARAFGKSTRLWQDVPLSGGEQTRQKLDLDNRPIVLLTTNVLGDSLTLGRALFSKNMANWILRTIRYFEDHTQAQLVIRVHPGERFMTGPSMGDIIKGAYPQLPKNVRVVGAMDKINTYDLIKLINLGLVFTSTTGLEMVMNQIPVIVAGETHYRNRGFTQDPISWEEYFNLLDKFTGDPLSYCLTEKQVELAWRYAYHFFFTFPLPFPWHLANFFRTIKPWPMDRVLGKEGQAEFGQTFRYLAGEPINWKAVRELHKRTMEPL
jgi:hypothetical protein